ncbi:uncharacterized protein [Magallana gigas]|uniref:uncharacterized protein n=1 Tax=Magallana gigas TaxID=29159 RepID=UPI00333E30EA
MGDNGLLKEILDSLIDVDTINLFAEANGLTGDTDVENRWEELLPVIEPDAKKSRQDDDQPSSSIQSGGGNERDKPYYIWKKDIRTFKNLARDVSFKVKFNEQWRGEKLVDIYEKLHAMFDDVLSQARGHDADLGRVDPSCGLQQHKVNFAVLQTTCHSCEKEKLEKDSKCSECGLRCANCCQMKKSKFIRPPCSDTCGHRELIFRGEHAAQQSCAYVTQPHMKNTILIAHNANSFDLYPILEVLIDRHSIRPDKIIYNGSKVMYMHIANKLNLTFLDSLNFLPMKLAKIPEAFGLEELSKGFFPHFFNTQGNQAYVGPYPALEFYGYDFMSSSDRQKLVAWHESKSSEIFNFQEEMLKYCRSDVDILRRGCMAFRDTVLQVTTIETSHVQPDGSITTTTIDGVDPFDYVTIASVCMGIFKTLFLKHNTEIVITRDQISTWHKIHFFEGVKGVCYAGKWIALSDLEKEENTEIGKQQLTSPIAVVPSQGYASKDNYSKISIQWLEWLMQRSRQRGKPVHICHALNGEEYHVPGTNYRCDGFAEKPNGKGTIYEFFGCVYHGCPDCFQHDRSDVRHSATNQTLDDLFKMTKKREKELKELGYELIVVWEHQFRYQLEKNIDLQRFVSTLD